MDARHRPDHLEDHNRVLSDAATKVAEPPGRPPTRDQIEYAEEFEALADAIGECPHADAVAILISTCRNQWMTANAAVADLSPPLRTGKSRVGGLDEGTARLVGRANVNPIAVSVERLREGHASDAILRLQEAAGMFSLASEKLDVWDRREEFISELETAVAALEVKPQARVRAWLSEQRNLQTDTDGRAVGEYIVLTTSETADGRALLNLIRGAHKRLAAATHGLLSAATYAEASEAETRPTLLDAPPVSAEASEAWATLRSALTTARHEGDPSACDVIGVVVPAEDAASEERARFVNAVLDRALGIIEEVRAGLGRDLQPNRPKAPLPAPYIIDVTPRPLPTGGRATKLSVIPYVGRTPEVPTTTRIALLRCGVPKAAYQEGALYQYRRTGSIDHAGRAVAIAHNAIARAAEIGAAAVVMPECFIPYDQTDNLRDAAEHAGSVLVGGVEHRPDFDGRAVNAVLTVVPGLPAIEQRKQRPSVYEIQEYAFADDSMLRAVERTPLGTLAVVVCSDYLESDIVWALASHRPLIDTLVISTRNPNPDVFSRLAAADALRLHANVVIVNSAPGEGDVTPSGEGTGIVSPKREDPWLAEVERVALDSVGWEDVEPPQLAVFDLEVAALSGRTKGRTEAGFAGASHYVTEHGPTDPTDGALVDGRADS